MNKKRIMVVLKKDLRENWMICLVILSIPLMIYLIPRLIGPEEITVGVCGELPKDFPFEAEYYSIEEGISAVENNDITAFYISEKKILYGSKANKEQVQAVAWFLLPENNIVEVSINSIDPAYLLLPLSFSIIILMGGIIGVPIVIASEKSERTLEALTLTPLTYKDFIFEKSFFGFISIFLSSLALLLISRAYIGNLVGTILLLALGALLFSLVAVMIATIFSTMESMMAAATPLLVIIIFIESTSLINSYSSPLLISSGIYKSMILNEFPLVETLILLFLIFIFIYINSLILRRTLRHE
jgi:hypothetical protein